MRRPTRRRFLSAIGASGITGVVGCVGIEVNDGLQGTDTATVSDESDGFAQFARAVNAVGRPWQLSAEAVTEEMVTRVAEETGGLLRTSVSGNSMSALKAITEATVTAFRELWNGQQTFQMELLRSEAKAAIAGTADLKKAFSHDWNDEFSGIGRSYDGQQPISPLFRVLVDDLLRLSVQDTRRNRRVLLTHVESIEYILVGGKLLDRFEDHSTKTGAKSLVRSIEFLKQSAEWIQLNIEVQGADSTSTTDRTGQGETRDPVGVLVGCAGKRIYAIRSTGDLETLVDGVKTKGVCAAADGTFWVTQQDLNRSREAIRNVNRDGEILQQFSPPDEGTRGIEIDDEGLISSQGNLYVVGHFNEAVFELTPSGETVDSYDVPAFEVTDIALDREGYLWFGNQNDDLVYQTEISGGELAVVNQWAPDLAERSDVESVRTDPHTYGLAVDDVVWVKDKNGRDIYRFSRDGTHQTTIELPDAAPKLRSLDTPPTSADETPIPDAGFERAVTVREHSGAELVDYPTRIELETEPLIDAGKLRPDLTDLRLLTPNGTAVNPLGVFAPDGLSKAWIWFRTDLAANQSREYRLQYGGPQRRETVDSAVDVALDFYEDFEEYDVGTVLAAEDGSARQDGWRLPQRGRDERLEVEKPAFSAGGSRALGSDVESCCTGVTGLNYRMPKWRYPDMGFLFQAIINVERDESRPGAGLTTTTKAQAESGEFGETSYIHVDSNSRHGAVKCFHFDERAELEASEPSPGAYDVRLRGKQDGTVRARYRPYNGDEWTATTLETSLDGVLRAVYFKGQDSGQTDSLRVRRYVDPEPKVELGPERAL